MDFTDEELDLNIPCTYDETNEELKLNIPKPELIVDGENMNILLLEQKIKHLTERIDALEEMLTWQNE